MEPKGPVMVATRINLTARRHVGRRAPISLIAIHTMEAPEAAQTAENVANYFKRVDASAHWCVDNDSRVRVVKDEDTAWTLPGANSRSLNIEIAGYAKQDADDWADEYSIDALEIAAVCAAEWCDKYQIPIRKLTDDQIRSGAKGFVGHVDVNRVYKQSSHWDPGPGFPWAYFLGRVSHYVEKREPSDPKPVDKQPTSWNNKGYAKSYIKTQQRLLKDLGFYKGEVDGILGTQTDAATREFQKKYGLEVDGLPGPQTNKKLVSLTKTDSIKLLQKAVGAVTDDIWGADTDKRLRVVMAASSYAGTTFPFGVKYAQTVVGTRADGFWGDTSRTAHDETVKKVQRALADLGFYSGEIDGVWGTATTAGYAAARKKFKR